ncbi:MAG: DUF1501 domain-containing protein [Gemmataceae bacterium]|nr:DUF1501 domain-containing protein [Gemmataceae bacterium]
MLNLFGSQRRLCDGISRRELLRVGGLGMFGFGLNDYLAARRTSQVLPTSGVSVQRPVRFGQAKACILIFLYGSPPQHETFDPKPDAPEEVRGEIGSIPSAVPGLRICELLPRTARIMDQVTVVRSMTHPYPEHGVAYAVSGIPTYTPELETRPRDGRHWPYIGSVVDYLAARQARGALPPVPRNVALPWMLNSKTDLLVNAGPFAAFLGQAHDPLWTDFTGPGTRIVPRYTDGQRRDFHDPFGGTLPSGRFTLSADSRLRDDMPVERLNLRQSLLGQFEHARRRFDAGTRRADAAPLAMDRHRERAYSLLTSNAVHQALDIGREAPALRERYGMTLFGQSCLAARRLVEAGSKFVTVFWDGYGQFANCAWDTHNNHFTRLKEYLLPGFDLAYPALIDDLRQRGLLDETLVLCISEHGRTPQIDRRPRGAGRHHWSRVYSAVFAGGGIARGRIVGSSDRLGGDVQATPVSPKDILATSFHLLGIDAHTMVPDALGRPLPIAGDGEVRPEMLG